MSRQRSTRSRNLPNDLYDIPFARGHGPGTWTYYTLDDNFAALGRISDSDAALWRVESILPQHPVQLTRRIEQHLQWLGL